jgi:hypothetical protein
LTDSEVKLGEHHIFSGNPMRSSFGWTRLSADTEWQSQMPLAQFAKVTAITLPLLRLYGYPLLPAAMRDRTALPS